MSALQSTRDRVAYTVELLLAVLDRMDGDCDLEEDQDSNLAGSHSETECDWPITGGQGL